MRYSLRKDIIYFKITSGEAYKRLVEYFHKRFLPSVTVKSLQDIGVDSFPCFLKLEGLAFTLCELKDEETVSTVITVRTKTKTVNSEFGSKVVLEDGLDLYPKFKRSLWNSYGVGFKITSLEDYHDICKRLTGSIISCEKDFSGLKVAGIVVVFVKEGNIITCIEYPNGSLLPLRMVSPKDKAVMDKANIVDYSRDYVFTSPIELY